MAAVPMPDDGSQKVLGDARKAAVASLKGDFPDSMLQQPVAQPRISVGVSGSQGTPAPGPAPLPAPDQPPPPDSQPVGELGPITDIAKSSLPTDTSYEHGPVAQATVDLAKGFGNGVMRGMTNIAKVLGYAGVTVNHLAGGRSEETINKTDDAIFNFIHDYVDSAHDYWQTGPSNPFAKTVGGLAEGLTPMLLGPAAGVPTMVASAGIEAGSKSVERGENLVTAATLSTIAAAATGGQFTLGFRDPNIVKRIAKWAGAGEAINTAADYLTKWVLNSQDYKDAAAQVDPMDPTAHAVNVLMQTVFALLHSPLAPKGGEKGPPKGAPSGTVPPPPPPEPPAPAPPPDGTPPPIDATGVGPGTTPPAPAEAPAAPAPPPPLVTKPSIPGKKEGAAPKPAVADKPTAEPSADIKAQIADLKDPESSRNHVYLAPDTVASIGGDAIKKLGEGLAISSNFDRKGGILISFDASERAKAAALRRANGDDNMQQTLGKLTGAGDGKQPTDTVVVQGQTPEGAVAREETVSPPEAAAAAARVSEAGHTPVVTTPEAAVARRAEEVAKEGTIEPKPGTEEKPTAVKPPGEAIETPPATEVPPEKTQVRPIKKGDLRTVNHPNGETLSVRVMGEPSDGKVPVRMLDENGKAVGGVQPVPEGMFALEHEPVSEPVTAPKEGSGPKEDRNQEPTKLKAKVPQPAEEGLQQALDAFKASEEIKPGRKFPEKLPGRNMKVATFARMLQEVLKTANVADNIRDHALKIANRSAKLDLKSDDKVLHNQGTGHPELNTHAANLIQAAENILHPEKADLTPPKRIQEEKLKAKKAKEATMGEDEKGLQQEAREEKAAKVGKTPVGDNPVKRAKRLGISVKEAADQIKAEREEAAKNPPKAPPKAKPKVEVEAKEPGIEPVKEPESTAAGLSPAQERAIRMATHRWRNAEDAEDREWAKTNLENTVHNMLGEHRAGEADNIIRRAMGELAKGPEVEDTAKAERDREIEQEVGAVHALDMSDPEARAEVRKMARSSENNVVKKGVDVRRNPAESIKKSFSPADLKTLDDNMTMAWHSNKPVSTHRFLDMASDLAMPGPVKGLMRALRAYSPDVPLRFTQDIVHLETGAYDSDNVSGKFSSFRWKNTRAGLIQTSLFKDVATSVRIALHEIAHAATALFVHAHPNDPHVAFLRDIALKEAEARARKMYGDEEVNRQIDGGFLYGLKNEKELISESLTNDHFRTFLLRSEAHATDSWKSDFGRFKQGSNLMTRIAKAITDMLGLKPGEADLYNEIMHSTGEIMKSQRATPNLSLPFETHMDLVRNKFPEDLRRFISPDMRIAGDAERNKAADEQRELLRMYDRTEDAAREEMNSEIKRPPPPLENEDEYRAVAGEHTTELARGFRQAIRSGWIEKIRETTRGLTGYSALVRVALRNHVFGHPDDPTNPLRNYDDANQRMTATSNRLHEPVTAIAHDWNQLTREDDRRFGQFLHDSSVMGIDPRLAEKDNIDQARALAPARATADPKFDQKWKDMHDRFRNLGPAMRELYGRVVDYNEKMAREQRKAAVGAALESYTDKAIPEAKRRLLYAVETPEEFDRLVGAGKEVDVGANNKEVLGTLKELGSMHELSGPYAHFARYGEHVVQVTPEGTRTFDTQREAQAYADKIAGLSPASSAKVDNIAGKWQVDYKAHHVSMHASLNEAHAEAERLRAEGFDVGTPTRKVFANNSDVPIGAAMENFVAKATSRLERRGAKDEARNALASTLRTSLAQMVAERSAFNASKMKRRNVGGVKPGEMLRAFVEHSKSTTYHTAQIKHLFEVGDALGKLQESVRNADVKPDIADQRGRVYDEISKRTVQEAKDFGSMTPAYDEATARIGFLNYMYSMSHTIVNMSQNFLVAHPTAIAQFGIKRATSAMYSAMGTVAGPAFREAFLAHALRTDAEGVVAAIVKSVAKDKRFGKWAQGENSPLQQLIDRGAIHSSLSAELGTISTKGDYNLLHKTFDYARIMPAMSDTFNRITTGLAALELHKGDVYKAADFVRETHMDYSKQDRSRLMRGMAAAPFGRSVAMFKTFTMGMSHLLYSNMFDLIRRDGGRAEALKTVAGLIIGSSLVSGIQRGGGLEPIRLMHYAWNRVANGGDHYEDFDTWSRRWVSEAVGKGPIADLINFGLPGLANVNTSSRLGLSDLIAYNPPDLLNASVSDIAKFGFDQLGPIPQMFLEKGKALINALQSGRVSDFIQALPIKLAQNLLAGVQAGTEGKTSSMGAHLTSPSGWSAFVNTVGFKTMEQEKVASKEQAATDYSNFVAGKKQELVKLYTTAATPAEKAKVWSEKIQPFNRENPGHPVVYGDLRRAAVGNYKKEAIAQGAPGRDVITNKLTNY